jgi:PIN domain nuclease of toxin-antitoxin system
MNILLDTHVALWAVTDDKRLGKEARRLVVEADMVFVSAASIWEIAIKHGLGRGSMPVSAKKALSYFENAGYILLPIDAKHAAFVEGLPAHHADPFDRMLVAQANCEPVYLITHDATVARYSGPIMLV